MGSTLPKGGVHGAGPSVQALAGWTLESEALTRDVGTWLLIYTCVCSCICWGISVPEQGGGEGWALVFG
jgi:hypothetical protein